MLTSLGFAALIGILGTFVAILWAGVIALAGTPCTALTRAGMRHRRPAAVTAGTVLASVIELYLLLAFAGVTSLFVAEFLARRPHLPGWPFWTIGWYLAIAPVLFSGWHSLGAQARDERDVALRIALPVAAVGYWVFVLAPGARAAGWPWLPAIAF